MHLSITYPEISSIVKQKAGHDIVLAYKAPDTITATYKAAVALPLTSRTFSPEISANLQVLEFKDNKLVIRMDAGLAGNFAISALRNYLAAHIPLTIYPGTTDGRTFVLDLCGIEQLRPVLEQMDVTSLGILPEGVGIDASFKL